jgi:hypothetical protein
LSADVSPLNITITIFYDQGNGEEKNFESDLLFFSQQILPGSLWLNMCDLARAWHDFDPTQFKVTLLIVAIGLELIVQKTKGNQVNIACWYHDPHKHCLSF